MKIGDTECYPGIEWRRVKKLSDEQALEMVRTACGPDVVVGPFNYHTISAVIDYYQKFGKLQWLNKLMCVISLTPKQAVYYHDFSFYLLEHA